MIKITKRAEPREWTEKKATPNFTYEATPELREALLEEQGYICAYCMRQIPAHDPNRQETSKIDHLKSRKLFPDLQLDYSNMVICCPGNIDSEQHCDTLKKENSISFRMDDNLQNSITYSTNDGSIKSSNSSWDTEINKILNLNHRLLKANRKETLEGVIEVLATLEKDKWTKSQLNSKIKQWSEFDKNDKLKPYCGIIIWYLQKKIKQLP
jgi:uncharacterized protein (TIGR02646 family)